MAELKHDKDGFLVGEAVSIDSSSFERALDLWSDIKSDTAAIRSALTKSVNDASRPSIQRKVAAPQRVSNAAIADAVVSRMSATPKGREKSESVASSAPTKRVVSDQVKRMTEKAVMPVRGANGRFQKKTSDEEAKERGGDDKKESLLSKSASALGDAAGKLAGFGDGADNIDPAIAAANEIKTVVSPVIDTATTIGKGVFGLFKRDKKEKVEKPAKEKKEKKEKKDKKEGGGGFLSTLMSIGPMILPMIGAALTAAFAPLLTIGARILPMLGTVFMRVLGPIAAVIGAWQVGQWIGEKIAAWLKESGVTDKITDGMIAVTEFITTAWGKVTGVFEGIAKTIGDAWDAVTNAVAAFIKDKFGIDIPKVVKTVADAPKKAVEATKEVAAAGAEKAKQVGAAVVEKGKQAGAVATETAGKAWDGTKKAAGAAKDWVLGKTSQMFESGKGGAGTVSTGKGDFGGASYGTYQLSSKQGQVQKFLGGSKYKDQFEGMQPGSAEFNAKWKEVAKSDPEFGNAQHDYIKKSHYDPAMEGLKKSGIDLSGRGSAVQDALWSTSVQFGAGNNKKGAVSMFQKALAGKDIAKMSDEDITNAVQDYKIANNDKMFASSSDAVRASTLKRASVEKGELGKLAATGVTYADVAPPSAKPVTAVPKTAQVPSAAPSAESMTPPPTPSPAPSKMGSNGKAGPAVTVNIPRELSQSVSDRGTAHVAAGGIGYSNVR